MNDYKNNFYLKTLSNLKQELGSQKIIEQLQLNRDNSLLYSEELEKAILGALLLEAKAIENVISILTPEMFYNEGHSQIYKVCFELFKTNKKIDMLTVSFELRKITEFINYPELNPFYISQLVSKVGSAAHLQYHCIVVLELFIKRKFLKLSESIKLMIFEKDIEEILIYIYDEITTFENLVRHDNFQTMREVAEEVLVDIEKAMVEKVNTQIIPGISWGFKTFDEEIGKMTEGELCYIGARPSMGKTATALAMAQRMSITNPVGFFTLEMTKKQIATRAISSHNEYSYKQLKEADFEVFPNIDFANNNLIMDDDTNYNTFKLEAKIKSMKMKFGIKVAFIDYISYLNPNQITGNPTIDITNISKNLKAIAKKTGVVIICLSQLNRRVANAGDRRPNLSDFRDSGGIEQDADYAIVLHRDEYYDIETKMNPEHNFEFIFLKHRNGVTPTIEMILKTRYFKFIDPLEVAELPF